MRVYLFDVCGTLFRDDTTLGFTSFVARKSLLRRAWLWAVSSRTSPLRWTLALGERATGRPWIRDLAILALGGYSRAKIDHLAKDYIGFLLAKRVETKPFALFQRALAESQVILASASLEPVVRALGENFSIPYVASELDWTFDRCDGRLKKDLSGQKDKAILRKFGPASIGEGCHCVSDNFSDRSLLEKCEKRTIVLRRASHRDFWKNLPAEYIEVFK